MEPMALDSPNNSNSGGVSPGTGGYLPPFLLGEITSPSTPHLRTNSLSPTKGRNLAFGSPIHPTQTSTPDSKLYQPGMSIHHQALYGQHNMYSTIATSPNLSYNKPNGPPIEDLFDTVKKTDKSVSNSLFTDNSIANNSVLRHSLHQSQINQSVFSPPGKSGWEEDYQQPVEEHWVTVFGFPPSTANTVLARLYNSGTIIDKQYPTSGNWAHVRYATRAEKERALSLNGRQISPGIMIGVVNCKEPPKTAQNNNSISSPEWSGAAARPLCPTALPATTAPRGSSGGVVSKTMEYLFGW